MSDIDHRIFWREEAEAHGANIDRVQVWTAFSDLFLDTSYTDDELDRLAARVSASAFSLRELAHIMCFEVIPVCAPNLFVLPGGEWALFDPDWLIAKCLKMQKLLPFRETKRLDVLPFYAHALPMTLMVGLEPYHFLCRVSELRRHSKGA